MGSLTRDMQHFRPVVGLGPARLQLVVGIERRVVAGGRALLEPPAVREACLLLRALDERSGIQAQALRDRAVRALARFFWARYLLRPAGRREDDGAAAVELFAEVYPDAPHAVPSQVTRLLDVRFGRTHDEALDEASAAARDKNLARLDAAIELLTAAVGGLPARHRHLALGMSALAHTWQERFAITDDIEDLHRAAALARRSLDDVRRDDSDSAPTLALASVLLERSNHLEDETDLDECLALFRHGLDTMPEGYAARPRAVLLYVEALRRKVERDDDSTAGRRAHALLRWLGPVVADDPQLALPYARATGSLLSELANRRQDPELRRNAIDALRRVVAMSGEDDPYRTTYIYELAGALLRPASSLPPTADAREAIALFESIVNADLGGILDALARYELGKALLAWSSGDDDNDAIDRAVKVLTAAESRLPTRLRHHALSSLADAHTFRGLRTGAIADLTQAVDCRQAALDTMPTGDQHAIRERQLLAVHLGSIFHATGDRAVLRRWVDLLRDTISVAGDDLSSRTPLAGDLEGDLADALRIGYELLGDADDSTDSIDEAIGLFRQVCRRVGPAERGRYEHGLGNALRLRHERNHTPTDLREAISLLRRATQSEPTSTPELATRLGNLGVALGRAFDLDRDLAWLDEGIATIRQAIELAAGTANDPGDKHSNLANLLISRYVQTGQSQALWESIRMHRSSVALVPRSHPYRARYLSNLAGVLLTQTEGVDDADHLSEAFEALQEAVAATDTNQPGWMPRTLKLGHVLFRRHLETHDGDLLDAAERLFREIANRAVNPMWLSEARLELAQVIMARFSSTGIAALRQQAIGLLREAIATASGYPQLAGHCEYKLARILSPFLDDGPGGDDNEHAESLSLYVRIADAAYLPASLRANAANDHGHLAALRGDFTAALAGFTTAIDLMERVAARGLERHDQERLLSRFTLLASNAAAVALELGDVGLAVELLERGRGVLLSRRLDRQDLHNVPQVAHGLVQQLHHLESQIDDVPELFDPFREAIRTDRVASQTRVTLAQEREQILAAIRAVPGLERFRRPQSIDELRTVAEDGPVVILNASPYGCHAILVVPGSPKAVPLRFTQREAADHAAKFIAATRQISQPLTNSDPADAGKRRAAQNSVVDTVAWLWRSVVRPTLDELGRILPAFSPSASTPDRPRLWWCPTGVLTFLPIHAAGLHTTSTPDMPTAACDRVISSYAPTLRSLLLARQRPPATISKALVIALPDAPGTELPAARAEIETLRTRFNVRVLVGGDATRDAVLTALRTEPWIHFAGHGHQDEWTPGRGHLMVHDGPVGVREIAAQRHMGGEFAYLSACDTHKGVIQLADEGLSIAVTLHIAGYRHVIGALWFVGDDRAKELSDHVYARLPTAADGVSFNDVAKALHHATVCLRRRFPLEPLRWAPLVHIGP